ncbi:hypothetical protein Tco_0431924 [Tanacetum coccineum]
MLGAWRGSECRVAYGCYAVERDVANIRGPRGGDGSGGLGGGGMWVVAGSKVTGVRLGGLFYVLLRYGSFTQVARWLIREGLFTVRGVFVPLSDVSWFLDEFISDMGDYSEEGGVDTIDSARRVCSEVWSKTILLVHQACSVGARKLLINDSPSTSATRSCQARDQHAFDFSANTK